MAEQLKSKSFLVKDCIYGRRTMFSIGETQADFHKSFKKFFGKASEPYDGGDWFEEGSSSFGRCAVKNNIVVILLRPEADIPCLAHEIFHAVEFHFEVLGLHHTEASSEAWAYYIQFLLSRALLEIEK
jgi:hypothetical protein